jgi:hypothetical protein
MMTATREMGDMMGLGLTRFIRRNILYKATIKHELLVIKEQPFSFTFFRIEEE